MRRGCEHVLGGGWLNQAMMWVGAGSLIVLHQFSVVIVVCLVKNKRVKGMRKKKLLYYYYDFLTIRGGGRVKYSQSQHKVLPSLY